MPEPLFFKIDLVAIVVVAIFAGIVAVIDFWKFKIYNMVTVPLMLTGLLYHAWVGYSTPGHTWYGDMGWSFLGILFAFFVLLVPWLMGGMSAGDVKLLMGIGAWVKLPAVFWVFITSSLAAGLFSVLSIVWHRSLSETWWNIKILLFRLRSFGEHFAADERAEEVGDLVTQEERRRRLIPFGVMVFLGVIATAVFFQIAEHPTPAAPPGP